MIPEPYPRTRSAIKDMVTSLILETATARGIARKAGVRQFAATAVGADSDGSFTLINDADGFAYTLSGSGPFPDADSMTRNSDLEGKSFGRLLANVATPFDADSLLSVSGAVSASVPIDAVGIFVSGWEPLVNDSIEWSASGSGSGVLGFCQLQTK